VYDFFPRRFADTFFILRTGMTEEKHVHRKSESRADLYSLRWGEKVLRVTSSEKRARLKQS
jgi:hypothetical protein